MALKVYVLKGTIAAGASETEIAKESPVKGRKWVIKEIRAYTDATADVEIFLYRELDRIAHITAESIQHFKLPYPMDYEVPELQEVRLTAKNPTASDAKVIVELVVDETAT